MKPRVIVVGLVRGVEHAIAEIGTDGALVDVGVVDFLAEMKPEDCAAEGRGVVQGVFGEECRGAFEVSW